MNNPPELPTLAAERLARGPQGRRAVISRDELIAAAMSLLGPTRSVSTLSLREVARTAGIAPNSFYRHFRDIDDLAIALIELAGSSLRRVFSEARQRISSERSVVRTSLEVFMEQLNAEAGYLDLLLREGKVGSEAFKQAVEKQLVFFEAELMTDLLRLEALNGHKLHRADLVARAITRLVFVMGASAADQGAEAQRETLEQTALMLKMIISGSRSLAAMADQQ
ncbi:MAG: HTH-type transcriptional repressor FabR [Pseudomonadota bacterium]